MTSFGASKICDLSSDCRNFETTFKILGQVYHKIGSLMPMANEDPKFLQIYFMGSCEERVTTRCQYNFIEHAEERAIVVLLEIFLENRNHLVQLFKRVPPQLKNDNYQIVIKADKKTSEEHAGRFNAPTVDEVAIVMVGDPVDNRSIKITHRDNTKFMNDTITDVDGYPLYRRRNDDDCGGGNTFKIRTSNSNQLEIDNQWEGSDLAMFGIQNINENDEIARYQMGKYISSNEAIWRILSFPIHHREPSIQHLAVHLENSQRVYFTEENVFQRAFEPPKTTLTGFFSLCQKTDAFGQFARTLLYTDIPCYFTWNMSTKKWEPRKKREPHPSIAVNGRVFSTYQDACRELQLLEDENHWDLTLADAALTSRQVVFVNYLPSMKH
ncbi:uncharacterized protein LOC129944943 [Eupeodes corollae]|uniref:uncharacterized protein LOC129944943 n=1 Tax=Eupeodes corollae TaxID=290404 RepID=UPI002492C85F|nr:uncharacterized protein LOC129944943 [Eupeodes corollae]